MKSQMETAIRRAASNLGVPKSDAQEIDRLLTAIRGQNTGVYDALQRLDECQRAFQGFETWRQSQQERGRPLDDAEERFGRLQTDLAEAQQAFDDCLTFASALQGLDGMFVPEVSHSDAPLAENEPTDASAKA